VKATVKNIRKGIEYKRRKLGKMQKKGKNIFCSPSKKWESTLKMMVFISSLTLSVLGEHRRSL
jgi:hypothetical protein